MAANANKVKQLLNFASWIAVVDRMIKLHAIQIYDCTKFRGGTCQEHSEVGHVKNISKLLIFGCILEYVAWESHS